MGIYFKNLTGDCKELLMTLDTSSIDFIMTSPPYADARKRLYNGPPPDQYVEWFMPIVCELQRVLKPEGTFILNIKERVVKGERHTYVLELILAMRKQGWLWTEEWVWHKRNSFPGKWSNRFRDSWERCLQFNLQRKFLMNQDAVMIPIGDWAKTRLTHLSETDKQRDPSNSGSSFGKNVSNWVGRDVVYPTNVLHLATECGNKKHPAAFPVAIPSFFIKLFTNEGDVVLDPFEGSGTTGAAAVELLRNYIGIDLSEEYSDEARERITKVANVL